MVTLCWAAKGGSGTTVVTATLALESQRPALLVDLAGELPVVLGMSPPDRPGVADWLAAEGAAQQLDDLVIEIDDVISFLPHRGAVPSWANPTRSHDAASRTTAGARWLQLAAWFDEWEQSHQGDVWIDAGTGSPPGPLADAVARRWLVTRACYLSLRRAAAGPIRPTGILLLDEAGRSLRTRDIERSVGAPIVARVPIDPKVARAVDSGLLASRPPHTIRRGLRRIAA